MEVCLSKTWTSVWPFAIPLRTFSNISTSHFNKSRVNIIQHNYSPNSGHFPYQTLNPRRMSYYRHLSTASKLPGVRGTATRLETPPLSATSQCRFKRIIVGVTGATGTLFAIHILGILKELGIETHLIMSKWALATMKYETSMTESEVRALATYNYTMKDMSAPPSSGSFLHDGMIVVPCSMKTLAGIRIGYCDDLLSRSADVCLKEGRKLVLAIRETPLSDIHLENMLSLRRAGAVIFPPVPAFYTRPKSIDELVEQSVGRMLDALGIHTEGFARWTGFKNENGM